VTDHLIADQTALANAVTEYALRGYTVESQTPRQVVFVRHGTRVNHILHLLLSLITGGAWIVMWILIALFHKRTKRTVITIVDDMGLQLQRKAWGMAPPTSEPATNPLRLIANVQAKHLARRAES
jgi:hypothetical protein